MSVEKNKFYEMTITDIGTNGEGVGKINDFVVFVPEAITGDQLEVKILKVKKNLAYGKIEKILSPSPRRSEVTCEVATKCGGCQLQHMSYEAQLEWKQSKVYNALTRIGGLKDIEVLPTLGMEAPAHYRNKAQYPIRKENGKVQIGFYMSRTHKVVDWSTCGIQDKRCEQIIEIVRNFLEVNNISIYDEETHKGLVRHLMIKTGFYTGEVMVCLVVNGNELPHSDKLLEALHAVEGLTSVLLNINKAKTNVILGHEVKVLEGRDYIIDTIGDLKFKISALSFFQVNPEQTKVLYDKALEYAELEGSETVWDAYCGIGTISLFLAQKAKKVYGVEIVAPAIENARENAALNDIHNAEFFVGKAEEVIPEQYANGLTADTIVVDPPRKGCDQALLETLVKMNPKKIVYVSCDPATLGRDLGYLDQQGYKVEKVQPVDMFPHTTHCETVVKLVK
ncbi:23S rRNA (uracil(1939)-C(5))-methyltransferase RlmD [Niameybacter massiliensis]|uniref:23S rRNA (Uracil(1939)-C(5))-methyltransferase RlmD n=1 Tax=Holtiella tumoricola TaxID=3018743 RepID=A0AA42DM48_9FIRM|nr:23S rRNA (uracil(1939)-C(5))-methyltransferase RlmD [Holtiella tumoricola]MDA3731455.1 23S rRNA (uracil(1939)-C(5))-methyltransferase RlmD [Holtiella tumoricola]